MGTITQMVALIISNNALLLVTHNKRHRWSERNYCCSSTAAATTWLLHGWPRAAGKSVCVHLYHGGDAASSPTGLYNNLYWNVLVMTIKVLSISTYSMDPSILTTASCLYIMSYLPHILRPAPSDQLFICIFSKNKSISARNGWNRVHQKSTNATE